MEKQTKFNPVFILPTLFSMLTIVWQNWALICSLGTFPKLPENWKDSAQVRTFLIALLQSATVEELVKKMPQLKWADKDFRSLLIALAQNDTIWNLVWNMHAIQEEKEQKKSLRERIRERISNRITPRDLKLLPQISERSLETGVTELFASILILEYTFNKQ